MFVETNLSFCQREVFDISFKNVEFQLFNFMS